MNENIDLTKILKDCPKGTKFYSITHGEVKFVQVKEEEVYPIIFITEHCTFISIMPDGRYLPYEGECILFPSKDQRDWSKFTAPWYKKERFNPKTLKAFDRVIVKPDNGDWHCSILSHREDNNIYYRMIDGYGYSHVIPYNNDTKHLVGTTDEAPEYYRYWEG